MSITVGEIVKAQGIKGEVKIIALTDDALCFKNFKKLSVEGTILNVEAVRTEGRSVFIKFKEIADRNAAEALVGKRIEAERAVMGKLPAGRYYIADLIGSKVVCSDKCLGILTDVLQNGAADVYVVDGGKIMFPALKDLLTSIDPENKIITLDEQKFGEVAVYNEV